MIKLLMRAPVRPSLCVAKGVIEKISSNRAMFESAILKETLYLAHSTISVRLLRLLRSVLQVFVHPGFEDEAC